MTLGLESWNPFATAQLPATFRWTSMTGVTIVDGGGRSGAAGDNCAALTESSIAQRPISPTIADGFYTLSIGQAYRFLTLTGSVVVEALLTPTSRFELVVTSTGIVRIRQWFGGVLLGTVCESAAAVVPIGTGGTYLEWRVALVSDSVSACQIRVRSQAGQMNAVAQGALLGTVADAFDTYQLGGGTDNVGTATWRVDDLYINDGVAAATPISYNGRLIFNDGFFGDTHIDALYATADGPGLPDPWIPSSGDDGFAMINEHPPDEDATYISADAVDQTSTFAFQHPNASIGVFARPNCTAGLFPIFAIQWTARPRVESGSVTLVAVVRRLITGELASDVVEIGTPFVVSLTTYAYYLDLFNRDPTLDDAPWTFADFLSNGITPGDVEFGVRMVA